MNRNLNSRTGKTLVLSSGKTIAAFGGIVLAMVLSRLFTKVEWGTYRQTFLVFKLASPLLGMGLSSALFYFLPNKKERNRGLLLENLIPLMIAGTSYLLFIVFGGNVLIANLFDNPMLRSTLTIMAPIAIFQLSTSCVGPCLISSDRVLGAALFSVFSRISLVVAVLITVCFSPNVFSVLWVQVIVMGLMSFTAIGLMLSVCTNGTPTIKGLGHQLAFGLPLSLSTMVGYLSRSVDRAMVSGFCSVEDFALYDNGAIELPLINIITGSMSTILMVDYRRMLTEEGRKKEILPLLHLATIKSGSVLIPVMFFLLCVAPEFMVCMFGEKYRESASVFRIYLLLLPARTMVFSAIALAGGRTKSLMIVPIVTIVVNVILNYFALIYFGYIGCAIVTVFVIYFVSAWGRAFIAQQVLECSIWEFIPWKEFGGLLLVGAIPVPLVLLGLKFAGDIGDLARLLIAMIIYGVFLIPIANFFGFTQISAVIGKACKIFKR